MRWVLDLLQTGSVAQVVVVLSGVVALGLALGSIRIAKVGLGIAGVLFSGLLAGDILHRCDIELDHKILDFAREFGLILFVYTIGMQVGPGFFASLRRDGLPLNLMAGAVVVLGALLAVAAWYFGGLPSQVVSGLYAGATTNTPALAAAQQAMKDLAGTTPEQIALPGMAYAIAYPFGIIGIILSMLIIKAIFRISPAAEGQALAKLLERDQPRLSAIDLEVRNPNLQGLTIGSIPSLGESGAVISRLMRNGQTHLAKRDMTIQLGDVLHVVGPPERLEQLQLVIGVLSPVKVLEVASAISARRILVTRSHVLGQTVIELDLARRFGVTVTRVSRAEIELPPARAPLQFGDNVTVVGEEEAIKTVASELGNSIKQLHHPQIIALFIGIMLGVLVGSWPLNIGLPAPVRLGLAGGPLIVAILLSRLGSIGPVVWYMSGSANLALRELGIVLFLACVGIRSGGGFMATLMGGQGFHWMGLAAMITLAPLLAVGLFARGVYKLNYLSICGLLAGSMTDPPALAFATHMNDSDAPGVSYATVYPLVMLLRVLSAQLLVILLS